MAIWFAFLLIFQISAQEKDFSSWRKFSSGELITETTAVASGAVATVGLRIRLEPGWHAYWANPGDSGAPLRLKFNNGKGVDVQRVMMPWPHRFETGPLVSFGYEKEVVFPIELAIQPTLQVGDTAHVEVEAEWLICKDVCIPAFQTFSVDLPVQALSEVLRSPEFSVMQKALRRVPRIEPEFPRFQESAAGEGRLKVGRWLEGRDFVDFFPFKDSGVSNEAPILKGAGTDLELVMSRSSSARAKEDRVGVLVARHQGQLEAIQFGDSGWKFEQVLNRPRGEGLWWMLLSAFLGGLILNLMPCVFPVLSIKLLSLLKLSQAHPRQVRAQNIAYVAGVLISFLAIACVLSLLRSGGALVGWGFQLQSPVFLALLSWLFFVLALNLLGALEFDFFDGGVGHRLTRLGGISGSFFTGILAVIVASPCTAPFMGVALGFGLAQPTPILLAIFLCLGLGLAMPYIVFAVFPSWIRVLPKPGRWMIRVKHLMALPLLLTELWLLWVLQQVQGAQSVSIVLMGCVALAFAVWLSEHRLRQLARGLAVVIVIAGLMAIYSRSNQVGIRTEKTHDELWHPYSPALLESQRGRSVFVNMTADWCLTCKVNERLVFNDPEVQELLRQKNVFLIKGDWTQRNEDITLFLNRYQRIGVPFYVLFSAQHPLGQTLPEVLTKSMFIDRIKQEFP